MTRAEPAIIALLLAGSVFCSSVSGQPAPDPLTDGPVTVTADEAEWRREGLMLYQGNVRLVSGGMELRGQSMELRQIRAGRYKAFLRGGPWQVRPRRRRGRDRNSDVGTKSIFARAR